MPKKRDVPEVNEPAQMDGGAIARANIEQTLAQRRTASAEGYVQVYLERGLLSQAEAEGYLAEIHKKRYGGGA